MYQCPRTDSTAHPKPDADDQGRLQPVALCSNESPNAADQRRAAHSAEIALYPYRARCIRLLGDNAQVLSRNELALHDDHATNNGLEQSVNSVKDNPPLAESTYVYRKTQIRVEHATPMPRESLRILQHRSRRKIEQRRWGITRTKGVIKMPLELLDSKCPARGFEMPELARLPRRTEVTCDVRGEFLLMG